ncbi:MAG: hypothetical protein ACO4AI_00205 [Prochlorothrix sp.]|nr:hypothetical protein [Prochlorothrix sp.]
MSSTLERKLFAVDDRYLNDRELQSLEEYMQSHALRLQTYRLLQSHLDDIVLQTLNKMTSNYSAMLQHHGQTCKRDLTDILRYISLCILKHDEKGFYEEFVLWMDTMMKAFKRKDAARAAYTHLRSIVATRLPPDSAKLVNSYVDKLIATMDQGS